MQFGRESVPASTCGIEMRAKSREYVMDVNFSRVGHCYCFLCTSPPKVVNVNTKEKDGVFLCERSGLNSLPVVSYPTSCMVNFLSAMAAISNPPLNWPMTRCDRCAFCSSQLQERLHFLLSTARYTKANHKMSCAGELSRPLHFLWIIARISIPQVEAGTECRQNCRWK